MELSRASGLEEHDDRPRENLRRAETTPAAVPTVAERIERRLEYAVVKRKSRTACQPVDPDRERNKRRCERDDRGCAVSQQPRNRTAFERSPDAENHDWCGDRGVR